MSKRTFGNELNQALSAGIADAIPGTCTEHGQVVGVLVRPGVYRCAACVDAEVSANTKKIADEGGLVALPGWNEPL